MFKEIFYGVGTFLCFFVLFWLAIDNLCSTDGDYVGPTPVVRNK